MIKLPLEYHRLPPLFLYVARQLYVVEVAHGIGKPLLQNP